MPSRLPRRSNTALRPALTVALVCATTLACAGGPFPLRPTSEYSDSDRNFAGVCASVAHQGRRTLPIGQTPLYRCQFPYSLPNVAAAVAPPAPRVEKPAPPAPKPAPVRIAVAPILFAVGQSELTAEDRNHLREAAALLRKNPDRAIRVDGYTDSTGTEAFNERLSLRRAQVAESYLIGQGISSDRLTAIGRGESNPVASNETAEGRHQNRRVEIDVP